MKLKTKFILYTVTIHLIGLVLAYFVFEAHKLVFIFSEVLIIGSLLFAVHLYGQLIKPLHFLKEGINAIRDKDFSVKFLPTGGSETDELISVYNQMIDQLRTERIRQEEQHFFLDKLVNNSPTGIIILDYDHQIKQINPAAASILSANPGFQVNELQKLPAGSSKIIKSGTLNSYKAQKSHFVDRGFNRFFIQLEEVTAEIFEAEKNVYGKVIRMMAHEVNNTIGPVNSIMNMALIIEDLWQQEQHEPLKEALQVAVQRNQNLNLFMRNLADLVKLSTVNPLPFDLVALINSVASFMRIQAEEKEVIFELHLPEQPVYITGDVQQIEQVLINIIKNAVESIDSKGTISFFLSQNDKRLIISDTGRGISEELNEQLFTPFFTTKKDGQGIGLTMVREILLNHQAEFSLKTVKAGQTDFTILFKS